VDDLRTAAQPAIPPADLPGTPGRFDLDRHIQLALADAPVFKVNGDLDQPVAEPLTQIGHFHLKAVAVAADAVQLDAQEGVALPQLKACGHITDPQPQDGAAVEIGPPADQP